MNVSNVEKIKEVKPVEGGIRRGNRFRAEIKEFNSSKNEAVIVLKDGKEIRAKIEGNSSRLSSRMPYNFEVLSYENGEMKLKIMEPLKGSNSKDLSSIESFMKNNKVNPELKGLLEVMMKHDIPLTKDNINKLNSFMDINKKSLEDLEKSIDNLSKYIKTRVENITSDKVNISELKVEIKETISQFLKLNQNDIAMLFENNIEFNKENFQSFNKVFKDELGIFNILKKLDEDIKGDNIINNKIDNLESSLYDDKGTKEILNDEKLEELKVNIENESKSKIGFVKEDVSNNINHNKGALGENEISSINKVNVGENKDNIIGFMDKEEINLIKSSFNDNDGMNNNHKAIKNEIDILVKNLIKNDIEDLIKNLNGTLNEEGLKILEKVILNDGDKLPLKLHKGLVEEKLFEITGKEVSFSDMEFNSIKESVKSLKTLVRSNKSLFPNSLEIVKEIKNKEDEMQGIVKRLIKEVSNNSNKSEAIVNLIKSNINDFKLFNNFSNEYYYLDIPININQDEYGVKLIIKDERGEGKDLDKNNMKLVLTVKTVNLGEVDALLKFSSKALNIEIKSNKESIDNLRKNLPKLEKSLELLGFMPYIFVSEKVYDKSDISTYREFFNNGLNSVLDKLI